MRTIIPSDTLESIDRQSTRRAFADPHSEVLGWRAPPLHNEPGITANLPPVGRASSSAMELRNASQAPVEPWCPGGVLSSSKDVCCPAACGSCGGSKCYTRPGGAENCCAAKIAKGGAICSPGKAGPPCRRPIERCEACALWSSPLLQYPALRQGTTAEVVVAACSRSLAWLPGALEDATGGREGSNAIALLRVTVYSKCAQTEMLPPRGGLPPSQRRLLSLVSTRSIPNVGRNDQTFALHLAEFYGRLADVIVCVKDTSWASPHAHLRLLQVSPADLLRRALSAGFACGRTPPMLGTGPGSIWHVRQELWQFRLRSYTSAGVVGNLSAYRSGSFVGASSSLPGATNTDAQESSPR